VIESPYEISFNENKDVVVSYQAIDNAGNPSGIGSVHVMIDLFAPVTNINGSAGWED